MRATSWQLVTPATIPVLWVNDLKLHLRVDHSDEDDLITAYAAAAVDQAETYLGRALLTQTWDAWFTRWPADGVLELPQPPLQSVTSVKYTPAGGTEMTLASSVYKVETGREPGRVTLGYGQAWPGDELDVGAPIVVRMVCGWTAAESVPQSIAQAVRWIVGHMYEHRESVSLANTPPFIMPMSVKWSLDPHRLRYGA
jgi:uncharacterized phiE125 gp8 family phage protein